jgi:hypothetical protein
VRCDAHRLDALDLGVGVELTADDTDLRGLDLEARCL